MSEIIVGVEIGMSNGEFRGHKVIVFGSEHYNPLEAIRSLGEADINPIVVIYSSKNEKVFSKRIYKVNTAAKECGFNVAPTHIVSKWDVNRIKNMIAKNSRR